MESMKKAVIMARGLGTRMRKTDQDAKLTRQQQAIADTGVKALIPIDRPFLDYVLHALAEAGYKKVCLIIGPEHEAVREYYGKLTYRRLEVSFAIQEKPLGTADAVRAAEKFASGDPFLVINSDNYYPPESLRGLRQLQGPGLAGFENDAMIAGSNIPADRIAKFAVIQIDDKGNMQRIVEKPSPEVLAALPKPLYVSMNCWRFNSSIFEACANIQPSPRGEYEIPDAVMYSIENLGQHYGVVKVAAPVLDLSSRTDVQAVTDKLKGSEVSL